MPSAWFSKGGLGRAASASPVELARNANYLLQHRPATESETLGWGPTFCVLTSPPGDSLALSSLKISAVRSICIHLHKDHESRFPDTPISYAVDFLLRSLTNRTNPLGKDISMRKPRNSSHHSILPLCQPLSLPAAEDSIRTRLSLLHPSP